MSLKLVPQDVLCVSNPEIESLLVQLSIDLLVGYKWSRSDFDQLGRLTDSISPLSLDAGRNDIIRGIKHDRRLALCVNISHDDIVIQCLIWVEFHRNIDRVFESSLGRLLMASAVDVVTRALVVLAAIFADGKELQAACLFISHLSSRNSSHVIFILSWGLVRFVPINLLKEHGLLIIFLFLFGVFQSLLLLLLELLGGGSLDTSSPSLVVHAMEDDQQVHQEVQYSKGDHRESDVIFRLWVLYVVSEVKLKQVNGDHSHLLVDEFHDKLFRRVKRLVRDDEDQIKQVEQEGQNYLQHGEIPECQDDDSLE